MSTNDIRMVSWCSFISSETNDSADYLRLLNSTWNDHLVRSVSDERDTWSKEFVCSICRLWFVNCSLFSIELMFCMQQCRAFGKWRSTLELEKCFIGIFRELNQDLFRRYLMQNSTISTRYVFVRRTDNPMLALSRCNHGLLKLIEQERQGETVDRSLMKSLIRMLIDLHVSCSRWTFMDTLLVFSSIRKTSNLRFYKPPKHSITQKVVIWFKPLNCAIIWRTSNVVFAKNKLV